MTKTCITYQGTPDPFTLKRTIDSKPAQHDNGDGIWHVAAKLAWSLMYGTDKQYLRGADLADGQSVGWADKPSASSEVSGCPMCFAALKARGGLNQSLGDRLKNVLRKTNG